MIRVFVTFRKHLRPFWRPLALGALLEIITTGLAVAQPWPLKVVVDDVLKAPGHEATIGIPLLTLRSQLCSAPIICVDLGCKTVRVVFIFDHRGAER